MSEPVRIALTFYAGGAIGIALVGVLTEMQVYDTAFEILAWVVRGVLWPLLLVFQIAGLSR